jgi:hypothetical protein
MQMLCVICVQGVGDEVMDDADTDTDAVGVGVTHDGNGGGTVTDYVDGTYQAGDSVGGQHGGWRLAPDPFQTQAWRCVQEAFFCQ